MLLRRQPAAHLRRHVTGYWGYEETTWGPKRRREGPGADLDVILSRRFRDAPPASPAVVWAWERLRRTHGRARIGSLAEELDWSRKRLVAEFREHIGVPPKAAARLIRFERARALAGAMTWAELAFECGFADQPHLISEFRAFTGRTPETFLQDPAAVAT